MNTFCNKYHIFYKTNTKRNIKCIIWLKYASLWYPLLKNSYKNAKKEEYKQKKTKKSIQNS